MAKFYQQHIQPWADDDIYVIPMLLLLSFFPLRRDDYKVVDMLSRSQSLFHHWFLNFTHAISATTNIVFIPCFQFHFHSDNSVSPITTANTKVFAFTLYYLCVQIFHLYDKIPNFPMPLLLSPSYLCHHYLSFVCTTTSTIIRSSPTMYLSSFHICWCYQIPFKNSIHSNNVI